MNYILLIFSVIGGLVIGGLVVFLVNRYLLATRSKTILEEAEKEAEVKMGDMSAKSTVIGITPAFVEILNYETEDGIFISEDHYNNSQQFQE